MMEGVRPFESLEAEEVAKIYANEDRRPPFKHHARRYPNGLKTLIEECWSTEPTRRPSFADIITRLTDIQSEMGGRRCLGIPITKCIPQDPWSSVLIHLSECNILEKKSWADWTRKLLAYIKEVWQKQTWLVELCRVLSLGMTAIFLNLSFGVPCTLTTNKEP
jgi:hypothetical protein